MKRTIAGINNEQRSTVDNYRAIFVLHQGILRIKQISPHKYCLYYVIYNVYLLTTLLIIYIFVKYHEIFKFFSNFMNLFFYLT